VSSPGQKAFDAGKFTESAFITDRGPYLENLGKTGQFWQTLGCYPDAIEGPIGTTDPELEER